MGDSLPSLTLAQLQQEK